MARKKSNVVPFKKLKVMPAAAALAHIAKLATANGGTLEVDGVVHLAEMVGWTQTRMSAQLAKWRKKGKVTTEKIDGRSFRIRVMPGAIGKKSGPSVATAMPKGGRRRRNPGTIPQHTPKHTSEDGAAAPAKHTPFADQKHTSSTDAKYNQSGNTHAPAKTYENHQAQVGPRRKRKNALMAQADSSIRKAPQPEISEAAPPPPHRIPSSYSNTAAEVIEHRSLNAETAPHVAAPSAPDVPARPISAPFIARFMERSVTLPAPQPIPAAVVPVLPPSAPPAPTAPTPPTPPRVPESTPIQPVADDSAGRQREDRSMFGFTKTAEAKAVDARPSPKLVTYDTGHDRTTLIPGADDPDRIPLDGLGWMLVIGAIVLTGFSVALAVASVFVLFPGQPYPTFPWFAAAMIATMEVVRLALIAATMKWRRQIPSWAVLLAVGIIFLGESVSLISVNSELHSMHQGDRPAVAASAATGVAQANAQVEYWRGIQGDLDKRIDANDRNVGSIVAADSKRGRRGDIRDGKRVMADPQRGQLSDERKRAAASLATAQGEAAKATGRTAVADSGAGVIRKVVALLNVTPENATLYYLGALTLLLGPCAGVMVMIAHGRRRRRA